MTAQRPDNVYEFILKIPPSEILPGETAPDHYTLLGLPRFSNDTAALKEASITRSTELRGWDNSNYHVWSNELLDEVIAAIQTLEDPDEKSAYDAELRQRLGLPEAKPVLEATPVVLVEEPLVADPFEESDGEPLAELPVRPPKKATTEHPQRGKATKRTKADDPETKFDGLFLKIGGGLIAVMLLIAVPVVSWTGRKADPVTTSNQSLATADISDSVRSASDPDWASANVRELSTLSGHTDYVTGVAFSADGNWLASASNDHTVKVWNIMSGQELLTFKGHTDQVFGVAFSPDGKRLASASGDRTVKVWDATSGQVMHTLKGHAQIVTSVTFSPDGELLASASNDQTVKVWDATSGQEKLTLKGHTGQVFSVVFSADGNRLASASYDQTVKVWDATMGRETLMLKGHTGQVFSVAFSPDGKRLVSASYDKSVRVWDATNGHEAFTLKGHTRPVMCVAFSPDGIWLASSGVEGVVKVWDAKSGQETLTLSGHTSEIPCVVFSPDGRRLASASDDKTVKIWGVNRTKARSSESPAEPKLTERPKPPPESDWDPASIRELATLSGHTGPLTNVAFSADGRRLASASQDQSVKVWDPTSGRETLALKGHNGSVESVAFSADGKRLASASYDKTVRVWNATSGRETLTFKGHVGPVTSVTFSADGKQLVSASYDKTVKVWDPTSGQVTFTFNGHIGLVWSVAYSADGKWLASASNDGKVKVWDVASGQDALTLKGQTSKVRSVAFSPDGRRLALADDRTVKLFDAATGQETHTLKGHSGVIYGVAFSPDSKRLASASGDRTVKVWEATSGQEMLTLKGHSGNITSVAFNPDGSGLASASDDKTVKIWGVDRDTTEAKVAKSALASVPRSANTNPSALAPASDPPSASKLLTSNSTALPVVSAPTNASMPGTNAGEERDDNSLKLKLCWCPPGSFTMGSLPAESQRRADETQIPVTFSTGCWMGKYEVTQGEWQSIMKTSLGQQKALSDSKVQTIAEGTRLPMSFVDRSDSELFCARLTEIERREGRLPQGWVYRLPTEAEWEYACRAGTKTATAFGDNLSNMVANYDWQFSESGRRGSHQPLDVGSYKPNSWGLCDCHGNVWEWCADEYATRSPGGRDPFTAPDQKSLSGVIRGGNCSSPVKECRSAHRHRTLITHRDTAHGFRVALGRELR